MKQGWIGCKAFPVRWALATVRDLTRTFATFPIAFPDVSRGSRYLQFPTLLKTLQSRRVREGYAKGNAKGLFLARPGHNNFERLSYIYYI